MLDNVLEEFGEVHGNGIGFVTGSRSVERKWPDAPASLGGSFGQGRVHTIADVPEKMPLRFIRSSSGLGENRKASASATLPPFTRSTSA